MKTIIVNLMLLCASFVIASVHAETAIIKKSPELQELQSQWAVANYQLKGKGQAAAFEELLTRAEQITLQNPASADLIIWSGIIKSTYAGVKGGLGALKFAKAAKVDFEQALELNPQALQGSAYTSLGTLYSKVPGWPIGFGDKKKAKKLLRQALEINPDGIDSNYFYGDFLLGRGKYKDANDYLNKALNAAPRADREVADAGRIAEIKIALEKVTKKLD